MKLQLLAATTKMELICCRLCFTPASELIDIFGDAPPTFDLVDVLEMYFHDEITEDDVLPKLLCNNCFNNVELFHRFVQRVISLREEYLSRQPLKECDDLNEIIKELRADNEDICIGNDNLKLQNEARINELTEQIEKNQLEIANLKEKLTSEITRVKNYEAELAALKEDKACIVDESVALQENTPSNSPILNTPMQRDQNDENMHLIADWESDEEMPDETIDVENTKIDIAPIESDQNASTSSSVANEHIENNWPDLKRETDASEAKRKVECDICLDELADKKSLDRHKVSMHSKFVTKYLCPFDHCDKHFIAIYELRKHHLRKHKIQLSPQMVLQKRKMLNSRFMYAINPMVQNQATRASDSISSGQFNGNGQATAIQHKPQTSPTDSCIHKGLHSQQTTTSDFKCIFCEKDLKKRQLLVQHIKKHRAIDKF